MSDTLPATLPSLIRAFEKERASPDDCGRSVRKRPFRRTGRLTGKRANLPNASRAVAKGRVRLAEKAGHGQVHLVAA